jgi:hypothetical protein
MAEFISLDSYHINYVITVTRHGEKFKHEWRKIKSRDTEKWRPLRSDEHKESLGYFFVSDHNCDRVSLRGMTNGDYLKIDDVVSESYWAGWRG